MEWWFPVGVFVATAFGGAVAGVAYLLIGGVGVTRQHSQKLQGLESDIDLVSERLNREIKRRSSLNAVAEKAELKSYKDLKADAERRLATEATKPEIPVPGFPTMFNRG